MFVLSNQLNIFRFIKDKFDTYTNIMKVLGLNMEPTLDPPNARKSPNTMASTTDLF